MISVFVNPGAVLPVVEMQVDEAECLRVAERLALAAGELIAAAFAPSAEQQQFTLKDENDHVTATDLAAEKLILDGLRTCFPSHVLIGEESCGEQPERLTELPTWMVDPLDGTTNFVHRYPHVAVSIGLCVNGQLTVAAVCDPLRRELFSARRGYGALLNGVPIRSSRATKLETAMASMEWPSDSSSRHLSVDPQLGAIRKALCLRGLSALRGGGSCVLDLVYVACGRLDLCWRAHRGCSCWDLCAGALIVEEAGGTLVGPTGGKFNVMEGQFIAGSSRTLVFEFVDSVLGAEGTNHESENTNHDLNTSKL